jgi:hypothetical protein|tara:strand:- start:85 stop:606 length:522 start_codon:yes stop_codon:yes gene_type:complete
MKNSFENFNTREKIEQETEVVKKEKPHGVSGTIDLYTTDKENYCREERLSRQSENGDLFTKEWECGCSSNSDGAKRLCSEHKELPQIERRDYVITKKDNDDTWIESAEVSTSYINLLVNRIEDVLDEEDEEKLQKVADLLEVESSQIKESLEENKGYWQKIFDIANILDINLE